MAEDELEEVAENVRILIREELETHHRFEGHPTPLEECPICQAHRSA